MAKRHRDILDKLDPIGVNRYNITEADIETIEKYLSIIQAKMQGRKLWQQIAQFPSGYVDSDLGVFIVEASRLEDAQKMIDELKGDTL